VVTYARHDGSGVAAMAPALGDLYAQVYAEPPYLEGSEQVERFRAGLPEDAKRPGFTLIAATDAQELVGAAYGWTMPAGVWWSKADEKPPAEIVHADKFAVMEWIVSPDRRGEGIGATLIGHLLAARPERFATLASDPRSAARAIYDRAGWLKVGQTWLPWGPKMDLLLLELS
jgi:GNAT superfamily N-acetyltransferase